MRRAIWIALLGMLLSGPLWAQTATAPQSAPATEPTADPAAVSDDDMPAPEPGRFNPHARPQDRTIDPDQAAALGVIEGLTEYLPVSSTGHLILVSEWMGMGGYETDEAGQVVVGPLGPIMAENHALAAFNIVIQLGAILAVVGLYRRRVFQMACGLAGKNPEGKRIFGLLMVAFLPAAVLGPLLDDTIETYLFSPLTVALALAVGGVLMIGVEAWYNRRRPENRSKGISDLTWRSALVIGLMQCASMWPGTSRSAATIIAGMLVGMNLVAAAEFSFLLALPTLGGATIYKGIKSWGYLSEAAGYPSVAVGMVVSGVVAAIAVAIFIKWLTRHGLLPFGVYRILLAAAVYAWFLTI